MPTGLNKLGDPLIGPLDPEGIIKQYGGDARLMPQNMVALAKEVIRLRAAMAEARDLLLEIKHGNPARSAGHNARLSLVSALNPKQ